MKPHTFEYTGAVDTPVDTRDYRLLGSSSDFPAVFHNEAAWKLPIMHQGKHPTCGAHAGAFLKALIDAHENAGGEYSPRYSWVKIKQFDGWPLADGTDMRSILKTLKDDGALPTEHLDDDSDIPLAEYSDRRTITPEMDKLARPNRAGSYGFATPRTFDELKRQIWLNKGVIVLMRLGAEWFTDKRGRTSWRERDVLPLRTPKSIISGHFVVAHSYDAENIYFANSWGETWGRKGHGYLTADYMPFINSIGTATDLVEAPATSPSRFPRDLFVGLTGEDVRELQRFLNSNGFRVAERGLGSPGQESAFFGERTRQALARFQRAKKIQPASGYFGPITRNIINSQGLAPVAITGAKSTMLSMSSNLFTLSSRDLVRGALTAVFAGAGFAIYGIIGDAGFDVFAADWAHIVRLATNGAFGGFVGYLFKRFLSDENGHTFGAKGL